MNTTLPRDLVWDVIVIGGGPAGMMAAVQAARRGRQVLLLEKNNRLGKKLSITGGGRCNVTNNKPVVRDMLAQYGDAGKFLFSTFTQHGVTDTLAWLEAQGVAVHEEHEGRLFPKTNSAETICQALATALQQGGVRVVLSTAVRTVVRADCMGIYQLQTDTGVVYQARSCVVAAGGNSRPDTGSTGDGFAWLQALGHTVRPSVSTLVPLALRDTWVSRVSGLSLPEVKLTVYADGQKQLQQRGKLLFTHVGVSGPTILNMSSTVGELLRHSVVTIQVDLFPDLDEGALRTRLTELLQAHPNQTLRNSLAAILPKALVTELLQHVHLDAERVGHSFSAVDRRRFVHVCKQLTLTVDHLLGVEKAVVTGGGVALEEIDFRTMQSRVVPGLYVVGDMLDINRPSGGYSLQLCWSTGWVAGDSV